MRPRPPVLLKEIVKPVQDSGVVAFINVLEDLPPLSGARRQIRTHSREGQQSVRGRTLLFLLAGGGGIRAIQEFLVVAPEFLAPGEQAVLVGHLLPRLQTDVAVGTGTRRGGLHDGTVRNFRMGYGIAFRK